MRIAIDARAFSWTGIGSYTRNLLAALANLPPAHDYIVFGGEQDTAAFAHFKHDQLTERFSYQAVEGSYYSWREQIILWRQLRRLPVDLFHFTHFNLPIFFDRPYVVTVHDITRFIFPGQRRQDLLQQLAYELVFKRALERARRVVCVSQTTAQDVLQLPLALSRPPLVIHQGVDPAYLNPATITERQKIRMLLGTNDPYLLFVGVWMSHKNIQRLLAAYAQVLPHYPNLKLVLTGRPKPGYDNIVQAVRQLGIEQGIIFAGFVPFSLLPALYAEATCFVFPSLYEGFGLPPLEAAASGVPVVASAVASIPEIMGDAAYYINPENIESIAAGIVQILKDQELRQQLAIAGKARVRLFDWQQAALKYHQLYSEVG